MTFTGADAKRIQPLVDAINTGQRALLEQEQQTPKPETADFADAGAAAVGGEGDGDGGTRVEAKAEERWNEVFVSPKGAPHAYRLLLGNYEPPLDGDFLKDERVDAIVNMAADELGGVLTIGGKFDCGKPILPARFANDPATADAGQGTGEVEKDAKSDADSEVANEKETREGAASIRVPFRRFAEEYLRDEMGVGHYLHVPAEDNYGYDISQHFAEVYRFMKRVAREVHEAREQRAKDAGPHQPINVKRTAETTKVKKQRKRPSKVELELEPATVYIHCIQGLNRSASVLCAFLMMDRHMSSLQAVTQVAGSRYGVLSNRAFVLALMDFGETGFDYSWLQPE